MGEWIGFSIMLLFSIGCYVLSGFFLHGKGACLIAGFLFHFSFDLKNIMKNSTPASARAHPRPV